MNEDICVIPAVISEIQQATQSRGFTMPSDLKTGNLLKTLAASKPGGHFLELGTGTGLSTAWLLAGMDPASQLISVDNDAVFQEVARQFLSADARLSLVEEDGEKWIEQNQHLKFDFIFADTWPGKYNHFEQTIGMLNKGGFYMVDDMNAQPNWPVGHPEKVAGLLKDMDELAEYSLTKMSWSTGIVLLVKK